MDPRAHEVASRGGRQGAGSPPTRGPVRVLPASCLRTHGRLCRPRRQSACRSRCAAGARPASAPGRVPRPRRGPGLHRALSCVLFLVMITRPTPRLKSRRTRCSPRPVALVQRRPGPGRELGRHAGLASGPWPRPSRCLVGGHGTRSPLWRFAESRRDPLRQGEPLPGDAELGRLRAR